MGFSQSTQIWSNFSMVADGYSAPVKVDMYGYDIQLLFTGTPTGTFFLQISDDNPFVGSGQPPANWTQMQRSIIDTVDIPDNSIGWGHSQRNYRWVRVGYKFVSGTGTITSAICNYRGC